MQDLETKDAGGGEGRSDALAEVKELFTKGQEEITALREKLEEAEGKSADYVSKDQIAKIEGDLAETLKREAELKARLSDLEGAANRPGASNGQSGEGAEELKSFTAWARGQASDFEEKAMATDSDPDGGYFVPTAMADGIQMRLRRTSPIRSIANVVSVGGSRYEMMVDRGDAGYEWGGERKAPNETLTPEVNRIGINVHELSALPKISQRLLNDAAFDVVSYLTNYVSDRFARAEATAYVIGDGVDKPRGFMTYNTAEEADGDRADQTLQFRATGVSGGFDGTAPGDVLIDMVHDLQAGYRQSASWVAKSTTAATIAKFKDGDGRYLLQRAMTDDGVLTSILQYPLQEAEDMPEIAAGSLSLAFGDFSRGYTIVDNSSVTVLRDPYTQKPFVLFYTTKRTGGGVTDYDAIKLLKMSV